MFAQTIALFIMICTSVLAVNAQGSSRIPATQNSQSVSIAIIIDMSGSAKSAGVAPKRKALFESLSRFVKESGDKNEYSIIPFSFTPGLAVDASNSIPDILSALKKLSSLKPDGPTTLYDACYMAIERVAQSTYPKRVVLVFSDGIDSLSDKNLSDVERLLGDTKVTLYAINSSDPIYTPSYGEGAKVLDAMASASGGKAFRTKTPEDVAKAIKEIRAKLRQ